MGSISGLVKSKILWLQIINNFFFCNVHFTIQIQNISLLQKEKRVSVLASDQLSHF